MMALVWRNKIADILESRDLSISDLQRMAKMSYSSTYRIVTEKVITDDTKAGTLRRVAVALGVKVTELFEEIEE